MANHPWIRGVISLILLPLVLVEGSIDLDDVELTRFRTQGGEGQSPAWVTSERKDLTFRVKACHSAVVALSYEPDYIDESVLEVEICSESGETNIRSAQNGTVLYSVNNGFILDCDEFAVFWISWEDGEISLGSDETTYIAYSDTNWNKPIKSLSFSTSQDIEGTWEFPKDAVRTTLLRSIPIEDEPQMLISQKSRSDFVFSVKKESNAEIGLWASFESNGENHYTVVIGGEGNTKSWIQKGEGDPFEVETPDILSGQEIRYFWISWEDDIFIIGHGKRVGSRSFLSWYDSDAISDTSVFSIFGATDEALWRIEQAQYDMLALESRQQEDYAFGHWLNIGYRTLFQFDVRACSSAVLTLRYKAQIDEQADTVRVELNETGSDVLLIIFDENGQENVTETFMNNTSVNCYTYAPLWFSWLNGLFQLGTGHDYQKNTIFSMQDPFPNRITQSLHLSSEDSGKVDWVFDRFEAKQTIFVTPPHLATAELTEAWMTIGDQHSLTIGVQACSDAIVVLASYLHIPDSSSYKITIGSNTTAEAAIEKVGSSKMVSNTAIDVLSCGSIRNLWVSWRGGFISIGKGRTVGLNTLASMADSDTPYDIQAAAFGVDRSDQTMAHWYLGDIDGEYYKFSSTQQTGRVWLAVAHSRVFAFKVRSEDTIRVTLSSAFGRTLTDASYVLAVEEGGEKNTSLSLMGSQGQAVFTTGRSILSKTDFVQIWISMSTDGIRFGLGDANEDEILHLEQEENSVIPVSGIMLSSEDDDAEWVVSKDMASVVEYNTMPYRNHGQMWLTPGSGKSVVFKVRAGAVAQMLLSSQVENVDVGVFTVGIGVSGNSATEIRRHLFNSELLAEVATPSILSEDEMRTFWISWDNALIQVGEGPYIGENTILTWRSEVELTFHGLSPSTSTSYEGFWEFLQFEDNTFVLTTNNNSTENVILTTRGQPLNFQVQSCNEVQIQYMDEFSEDGKPIYVVDIGSAGNSEIKITSPFVEEETSLPYPGVLNCAELRPFWTALNSDGLFEFGEGTYPHNLLLDFDPVEGEQPTQFALLSPGQGDPPAYWHVGESAVESLEVKTSKREDYNQLHILVPWMTSYSFQVEAESNVHIMLVRIPGRIATDSYEITIASKDSGTVEILKSGNVVASVEGQNNLLDHFIYTNYWLSWEGGLITVGKGYRSDSSRLIHWQDPSPHSILALHVSTGDGVVGHWMFSHPQGNVYEIETGLGAAMTKPWLATLPEIHYLSFRLTECKYDVSLDLSQSLHDRDIVYELAFTNVIMQDAFVQLLNQNGTELKWTSIEHSFVCRNPLDYWISWSGENFQFGTGRVYSSVKLQYESSVRIKSVFLKSAGPTRWQFYENQLSGVRVHGSGPEADHLWLSLNGRTSQVFDVMAGSDADIVLGPRLGDSIYLLELQSSADNVSSITNLNTNYSEKVDSPGLLSKTMFRTFWLSWDLNSTTLGQGPRVGQNEVLRMSEMELSYLGAIGFEADEDMSWVVLRAESETYTIKSNRLVYQPHWFFMNDTSSISFRVKTCSSARIRLVSANNDWLHDSYDILIGGEGNTRSFILNSASQQVLEGFYTPSFLSCNELRRFWLSWGDEVIEMGSGDFPDNVFLTHSLSHALASPALNFYREEDASEWEIPHSDDGALLTHTNDFSYESTWLNLQGVSLITLSVKACSEAHVVMTPISGVITEDDYAIEVILGAEANTAILVKSLDGKVLGRAEVDGSLSCDDWRQFWLTWSDHDLQVGQGQDPSANQVMSVDRDDPFPLNAISFGSQSEAQWLHGHLNEAEVPRIIEDDFYMFYTNYSMDDRIFGLSTDSFVFSVMACKDASVVLRAREDDTTSIYIITFGVGGDNMTRISKIEQQELVFPTADALSCDRMMPFWLQWSFKEKYISVGKGTVVGVNEIGRMEEELSPYPKNFISFFTPAEDAPGRWQIYQTSVHSMIASTGPEFTYEQIWWTMRSQDWQVFQVQACNDAHILLSDSPESEDTVYEIALGIRDNQDSAIRRSIQGPNAVEEPTSGILECNEMRTFWISWSSERIEVGRGSSVGSDMFIRLTDAQSARSITSLSISTGWGSTGLWKTNSITDPRFTFQTGPGQEPHATLHLDYQYVTFRVRGCEEAMLHFSASRGNAAAGYDVTFGADSNQKTLIKDVSSNTTTEHPTPDILECNTFRSFWLSWHNDELVIGRGKYLEEVLFQYTTPSMINIRYMIFSSKEAEDTVTWEVPKSMSRSVVVTTDSMTNERNWLTVPSIMFVNFKVRACPASARLVLQQAMGSDPGFPDSGNIEITLNETSQIVFGGTARTSYEGSIINCEYGNWFWVRWTPMEVTVGQSPEVGDSVIMTWTSESGLPSFESVEFETPEGSGTWEFLDFEDGVYTVTTDPKAQDEHVWLTMFRKHFSFEVKACEEAIICLSDTLGNCAERAVQVTLGGESNTKSTISSSLGNGLEEANTTGILDCKESKPFWITWSASANSAEIQLGEGRQNAGDPFLEYSVGELFNITSVSLMTEADTIGEWQFKDESALSTKFFSPVERSQESVLYHTPSGDSLVFSVKGCSDAVILLYDHLHSPDPLYRVVIGGDVNSKTWIDRIDNEEIQAVANTSEILSCTEPRWFWINWATRGLVTFGTGERLYVTEMLTLDDPAPRSVSYVGLTSNGQALEWDVPLHPEESFIVSTPVARPDGRAFHVILPQTQRHYEFGVRACESAKITLTTGQSADTVLELVIGDNGIYTNLYNETTLLTQALTPGMLDCNENRVFYISWEDNVFDFYLRSENGRKVFTYIGDVDSMDTSRIHGITIDAANTEADWSFTRSSGKSFRYIYPQTEYDMLWQSVYGKDYVIFSVQACRAVRVILSDLIGAGTSNAVEAGLQVSSGVGDRSEIRNYQSKTYLEWTQIENLLSCDHFRTFWISWYGDVINVGAGALVGQQIIVSAKLESPLSVSGVSYAAEESEEAVFEFGVNEGNMYQMTTIDLQYERLMVIPDGNTLQFSVSSGGAANMLLVSKAGNVSAPSYELVIGYNDNQQTVLRSQVKSKGDSTSLTYLWKLPSVHKFGTLNGERPIVQTAATPDALSCDQPQDFWVSYADQALKFGLDSVLDEHMLLTYEGDLDIQAIHLSAETNSTAQWSYLVEDQKLVSYVFAQNQSEEDHFWMTVSGYSLLVFSVRACQNARLVLTAVTENTNFGATEIVIGEDNQQSFIRSIDGDSYDEQDTPEILDCSTFQTFWVKWSPGSISVGQGADRDLNMFLSSDDISPHFTQAIAFSRSSTFEATYKFDGLFGKTFAIFTPATYTFDRLFIQPSQNVITFRVKTCADAIVALAEENSVSDQPYFEVLFGSYDNTNTEIRKVNTAGNPAFAITRDVVSCDQFRSFWISWDGSGVKVGYGLNPEAHELLHYRDAAMLSITHVSFASWTNHPGQWEIFANYGDFVELPSQNEDDSFGVSVVDTDDAKFRVQACQSVSVVLTTIPDNVVAMAYEVVLGDDDNSALIVRRGVGGPIVAEEQIDGLLHCEYFRTFWISWANQSLAVGRGPAIGEDEVLSFQNDLTLPFTAMSAFAGQNTDAQWQFASHSDYPFDEDIPSNDTSGTPQTTTFIMPTEPSSPVTGSSSDTTPSQLPVTGSSSDTTPSQLPVTGSSSDTTPSQSPATEPLYSTTEYISSQFPSSSTSSSGTPSSTTNRPQVTEVTPTEEGRTPPDEGGLGAGAIVGIVFGVLIAVALIGTAGFFAIRKLRRLPDDQVPFRQFYRNPLYGTDEEDMSTA